MSAYSRWRTVLATLAIAFALSILGCFAVVYSGVFNVAATDHHWPITRWIMETARTHSIKARAAGIQVPPGLDDEARLVMGTEHFADHCAVCHGAPGVPQGEMAKGLYPPPPDFGQVSAHLGDAELFWVIKNGIKMTGMPAWTDHSDDEIWATVAFLKKLRGMTPEEYGKLIMAAMAHSGHRQPAAGDAPAPPAGDHGGHPPPAPAPQQRGNPGGAPGSAAPHGH
jgi:mono/diheme cytochrome c family protein